MLVTLSLTHSLSLSLSLSDLGTFLRPPTSCTKKVFFSPLHLPATRKSSSKDTLTQLRDGGFEGCWGGKGDPYLHSVLHRLQATLARCSLATREGLLVQFTGKRRESRVCKPWAWRGQGGSPRAPDKPELQRGQARKEDQLKRIWKSVAPEFSPSHILAPQLQVSQGGLRHLGTGQQPSILYSLSC